MLLDPALLDRGEVCLHPPWRDSLLVQLVELIERSSFGLTRQHECDDLDKATYLGKKEEVDDCTNSHQNRKHEQSLDAPSSRSSTRVRNHERHLVISLKASDKASRGSLTVLLKIAPLMAFVPATKAVVLALNLGVATSPAMVHPVPANPQA
jgi:hypothetical protein